MKLLALRCPHCATPLAPGERDVVTFCPQCRSAVLLAEDDLSLAPARYGAPVARAASASWVPFWRFEGAVTIERREAQNSKISLKGWVSTQDSQAFWSRASRYYIPAWDLDLPQASEVARELLESQPDFRETTPPPAGDVRPAIITPDDARKLLELAIVTVEARRSDWLKDLEFTADMGPPALWLLPAEEKNGRWHLLADTTGR